MSRSTETSISLSSLCEIGYQLAHSFRALHLSGFSYRDVSYDNVVFDPEAGDVLIIDNDNVGVDDMHPATVGGTLRFMAPEIVRSEAMPSAKTDLHSLAVLLFYFWHWEHPLEGSREASIEIKTEERHNRLVWYFTCVRV